MGLSVLAEETTPSAYDKLIKYTGPTDILRSLFNKYPKNGRVEIAFVDSRKGSAGQSFCF